ncbi:DUF368 domain-containing protein [Marinilabiliaceae bacterium ANBcel2]|nr:DUF368 domain-containing protein [Marinilabiliaceae bacterium ANBcel2]
MYSNIKNSLATLIKGVAMGAANVIPGVSGGTIALITGIFERLILSIKSFDIKAAKLLFNRDVKGFIKHTDLIFLTTLFLGIGVAIFSLAQILGFLFLHYPVFVWAYFFGLVMASVWFVGKTVNKWHIYSIIALIIGAATAMSISILSPATENSSLPYLFLCGIIAVCSMILPGLSGSFVLILMGNYQLVMIDAVNQFNLNILLPVIAGGVFGMIAFARILSWLLKKFPDSTIALLTGFITGSLGILWPWKNEITESFGDKIKVIEYEWYIPALNSEFYIALILFILGITTIALTEVLAITKSKK